MTATTFKLEIPRRKALENVKRWARRGFIRRFPFTESGVFTTFYKTTFEDFIEALEALDGVVLKVKESYSRGKTLYEIEFTLPDLPELSHWCNICGRHTSYCTCKYEYR